MAAELTLHIPAAHAALFLPALAAAAEGLAEVVRDRPLPVLDLAGLRCLNLSLFGSLEHVRTPFAYPFLRPGGFNLERPETALHELPGADWLALGGDPQELAGLAGQALRALQAGGQGRPVLRLRPFARLGGRLPQEPLPGEPACALRKSAVNFNQPTWLKTVARLMDLPEARWGEVGIANTADLLHIFSPALERLVLRPPRLVIDLGCGLGQIARSLAQRFPDALVVGVDASPEAIAVANKHFQLPNLRFAAVDFSRPLNFAPGSADLIVSTNALPYAQNQLGAARELFGLLAPDGVLLNHCRAEESHLFWDFPRSLLLPTNTQIFLCDWFAAARESGRATELSQVPLGLTPAYYQANQLRGFAEPLARYADECRHDAPGPYVPWASHVLLAHAAHARPADEAGLPLAENHFERLGSVLAALPQAPALPCDAAIEAWVQGSAGLQLWPEALDFCAAAMPQAESVLRAVLGETLAKLDQIRTSC